MVLIIHTSQSVHISNELASSVFCGTVEHKVLPNTLTQNFLLPYFTGIMD